MTDVDENLAFDDTDKQSKKLLGAEEFPEISCNTAVLNRNGKPATLDENIDDGGVLCL